MGELLNQAKRHRDLVVPGYTHLRKAQPILLAHYLLAWFEMFSRDRERFEDCFRRTDCMPLGAGALAGNAFAVDREALGRKLNFSRITANSLDAVSDRDYLVDFVSAGSPHPGASQPTGRGLDFLFGARVAAGSSFPMKSPPAAASCRRRRIRIPWSCCAANRDE